MKNFGDYVYFIYLGNNKTYGFMTYTDPTTGNQRGYRVGSDDKGRPIFKKWRFNNDSMRIVRVGTGEIDLDGKSAVDFLRNSPECKGSKSGPQSMASGGSAPLSLRSIDESYVGRLDLTTTSSNDPGIAFTVSPFLERHDPNGTGNFFFTDAPNLTLVTEDGEIFGNDDYDLEIDVDEIMEEDE